MALLAFCCLQQTVLAQEAVPAAPASAPSAPASAPADAGVPATLAASGYRINRGDELNLRFFFTPELNTVATVRSDGFIALPLVGELHVEGMSITALAAQVEKLLSSQVRRPQVAINVQGTNTQRVFVGGEVARPGVQNLLGPLTVLSAVMSAEGLKDTAQPRNVIVLRRGPNGERLTIPVDLEQVISGADPSKDLLLQPQDVVVVPRSGIASVGLWVDQYIRRVLPFSIGFNYTINSTVSASP